MYLPIPWLLYFSAPLSPCVPWALEGWHSMGYSGMSSPHLSFTQSCHFDHLWVSTSCRKAATLKALVIKLPYEWNVSLCLGSMMNGYPCRKSNNRVWVNGSNEFERETNHDLLCSDSSWYVCVTFFPLHMGLDPSGMRILRAKPKESNNSSSLHISGPLVSRW